MKLSTIDYPELLIESQKGDSVSLNNLALKIQSDIRPYVYRMLFNMELTDDITQETLLSSFELIHTIRQPKKFRCWLYRMARGKVQMHFREKKRLELTELTFPDDHICKSSTNGLTRLIQQELSEAIMLAMDSLKESHRTILILRLYQNLSYDEIAEILTCSSLSAKAQFYRAKQVLRKKLNGSGFNKTMLLSALLLLGNFTSNTIAQTSVPLITRKALAPSPAVAVACSGLTYVTLSAIVLTMLLPWQVIKEYTSQFFWQQSYQMQICYPTQVVSILSNKTLHSQNERYGRLTNIKMMDHYFSSTNYEKLNIVIESGESIEFKFPGTIANGPGDDIFVVELGPEGESVEVYLRDQKNNEIYLGTAQVPKFGNNKGTAIINYPISCNFDLSNYDINFDPTHIKLVGSKRNTQNNGFELQCIQANVNITKEIKK